MSQEKTPQPDQSPQNLNVIPTRDPLPFTQEADTTVTQGKTEGPTSTSQDLPLAPETTVQPKTPSEISTDVANIIDQLKNSQSITKEFSQTANAALQGEVIRLTTLLTSKEPSDLTVIIKSIEQLKKARQTLEELQNTIDTPEKDAFKKSIDSIVEDTLTAKKIDNAELKQEIINYITTLFDTIHNAPQNFIKLQVVVETNRYIAENSTGTKVKKTAETDNELTKEKDIQLSGEEQETLDTDVDVNEQEKKIADYPEGLTGFRTWLSEKFKQKNGKPRKTKINSSLTGTITKSGKLTDLGEKLHNLDIPLDKESQEYNNLTGDKREGKEIKPNKPQLELLIFAGLSLLDDNPNWLIIPDEIFLIIGKTKDKLKEEFRQLDNEELTLLLDTVYNNKNSMKTFGKILTQIFLDTVMMNKIEPQRKNLSNDAQKIYSKLSKTDQDKIKNNPQLKQNLLNYLTHTQGDAVEGNIIERSLKSFDQFEEELEKEQKQHASTDHAQLNFYIMLLL